MPEWRYSAVLDTLIGNRTAQGRRPSVLLHYRDDVKVIDDQLQSRRLCGALSLCIVQGFRQFAKTSAVLSRQPLDPPASLIVLEGQVMLHDAILATISAVTGIGAFSMKALGYG
jgi:hypothetical protein